MFCPPVMFRFNSTSWAGVFCCFLNDHQSSNFNQCPFVTLVLKGNHAGGLSAFSTEGLTELEAKYRPEESPGTLPTSVILGRINFLLGLSLWPPPSWSQQGSHLPRALDVGCLFLTSTSSTGRKLCFQGPLWLRWAHSDILRWSSYFKVSWLIL